MIHQEQFLVRAIVQVGSTTLATAMAAASDLETAEDRAKLRVLEFLGASPGQNFSPIAPPSTPFFSSTGAIGSIDVSKLSESSWQGGENSRLPEATVQPIAHHALSLPSKRDFDAAGSEQSLPQPLAANQNLTQPTSWPEPLSPSQGPDLENLGLDLNLRSNGPIGQPTPSAPDSPIEADVPAATSLGHAAKPSKSTKQKVGLVETPDISIPPSPNLSPNLADCSEEIMKIGIEMKRLGWSTEQGREYLKRTYGKRSRQELEDAELLDFLRYLELQPSPMQTPF